MKLKHYLLLGLLPALFAACQEEEPEQPLPALTLSSETQQLFSRGISAGAAAAEYQISFTATKEWSITPSESWLSAQPSSGKAGSVEVTLNLTENTSLDARTATVALVAGDVKHSLAVSQSGRGFVVVTSITLNESSLTMHVGDEVTLVATVEPSNADNGEVTWSSSEPTVVSVDEAGLVTALDRGTATVTANAGGFSASCEITVSNGWTVLGVGYFQDNYIWGFAGMDVKSFEVEIEQSEEDANTFRIYKPYGEQAKDDYFYFSVAEDSNLVSSLDYNTGLTVSKNDKSWEAIIVCGYYNTNFCKVLQYQDSGLPALIELGPCYRGVEYYPDYNYDYEIGKDNTSLSIQIAFPGYTLLDEPWIGIGKGKFMDKFIWEIEGLSDYVECEFEVHIEHPATYRIAKPYPSADSDEWLIIYTSDPYEVYSTSCFTGTTVNNNGTTFKATMLNGMYGYNFADVVSFDANGKPAIVELCPCYRGVDGFDGTVEGYAYQIGKDHEPYAITIVFPGNDEPAALSGDVSEVVGEYSVEVYEGYYGYGRMTRSIVIAESDNAEKGNVMITSYTGFYNDVLRSYVNGVEGTAPTYGTYVNGRITFDSPAIAEPLCLDNNGAGHVLANAFDVNDEYRSFVFYVLTPGRFKVDKSNTWPGDHWRLDSNNSFDTFFTMYDARRK